ncbi:hypothetical protein ATANTOWER_018442, partial [Ataeniobius toweri]|nr:hypothetical protein [Ataeniobius toweri]
MRIEADLAGVRYPGTPRIFKKWFQNHKTFVTLFSCLMVLFMKKSEKVPETQSFLWLYGAQNNAALPVSWLKESRCMFLFLTRRTNSAVCISDDSLVWKLKASAIMLLG